MSALDAFDLAVCDDTELGRRAAAGDVQARRELIERYVPLARRLALRYRRSGEAPDDLIQVASLALVKVVDRWHAEMGYAFSSYAVPTILGDLRRYFRDATWIVRPPRGLIELSLLVESERQKLGAVLGRDPTVAELAERLDRPHAVGDRSRDRLLAGAGLPDHQDVARAAVRPRLHGLRMVDERHNRRGDGMTSRRAHAYARVTMTLDNLGPAKLLGPEQAQIRRVVDTLLFCADLTNDPSARAEFAGVEALLEHLVACGRWSPERAGSLGDDVWACGPGPDAFHLLAA
jgi:RNA polymerase sigma factor (sigma-70 family)